MAPSCSRKKSFQADKIKWLHSKILWPCATFPAPWERSRGKSAVSACSITVPGLIDWTLVFSLSSNRRPKPSDQNNSYSLLEGEHFQNRGNGRDGKRRSNTEFRQCFPRLSNVSRGRVLLEKATLHCKVYCSISCFRALEQYHHARNYSFQEEAQTLFLWHRQHAHP